MNNIKTKGNNKGSGKGQRYQFNKVYKLSDGDRWTESDPANFKQYKRLAERYLTSEIEDMSNILKYASKQKTFYQPG